MLKIIACDDDVAFLDRLHRMIDRWSTETGTAVDVALVTRGEDLLARHAASRADIILLDMIMPLVNGMDTARELRQADTAVRLVFLTSSPEFALESYEVRAFDYLLKPVTYERLAQLLDELSSMRPAATDELVIKTSFGYHALRLSDIAQELEIHESTVSRAIRDKYVQCPRGVFPLRHFLSRRAAGESGAEVGSCAAKELLRRLIREEDSTKPLSDQKLCTLLTEQGCPISRRTVAKYREDLNIPSASGRKRP